MFRRVLAAVGLVGCMVSGALAQTTSPTLPSIGVDAEAYVTSAGTEIGTVLAAIFGLFVVLMVIFGAMRWLKRVRSA